jgi:hypothetical protein
MNVRTVCVVCAVAILLATQASVADDPKQGAQPVVVDFAKPLGKIRALHGVQNGPVVWGINADLTRYHAEAGFPSTRLGECHYPSPDVVDVPVIFPIFDADAMTRSTIALRRRTFILHRS